MATTALTIINRALAKNGVDEPAVTEQIDALDELNNMLSYFSIIDLVVPYVTPESLVITTVTVNPITIGSSGVFNTVRPIKITDAYIRDSNSYDYKIDVNMTEYEYNSITTKATKARPTSLWYSPSYPLGNIYLNCPPDASYTFFIDSIKRLTEFALLSTSFNFSPEYKLMLIYNLAVIISPEYGSNLSKEVLRIAEQSKMAVMTNNIRRFTASVDD